MIELRLDGVEHVDRVPLVAPYQADEAAGPGQDRPDACPLAERGLARAARHCQGKEAAVQHRLLNPRHDLQVVGRPRQVEGLGEVCLTEGAKRTGRPRLPLRVGHSRQRRNVASLGGEPCTPLPRPLLYLLVSWLRTLTPRQSTFTREPRCVARQVHRPPVPDPVPGTVALAVEDVGLHDLAQGCGVQDAGEFRWLQRPGVKLRHRRRPSVAHSARLHSG